MSVQKIRGAVLQNGGALVEILFDFLQREGIDAQTFNASLPFHFSREQADTLEFSELEQLLAHAGSLLNDSGIILRYGQQVSVAALGTLGYALLCSSNLAEVLKLLVRYQRLISPVLHVETEITEEHASLVLSESLVQVDISQMETELFFSTAAACLYQFFGREHVSLALYFSHAKPAHVDSYIEVFGDNLTFEADKNAIMIGRDVLATPMQFANPAMLKRYQQECDELLRSTEVAHYTMRVQSMLLSRPGKFPSFEQAADALHIGARTLRRRLQDEGTSYKQIVQDMRRAIAEKYLSQSLMSIAEVADMLGYTDVANFRRAFISWTGETPAKYRAQRKKENSNV